MKKIISTFLIVSLALIALSGCATAPKSTTEPIQQPTETQVEDLVTFMGIAFTSFDLKKASEGFTPYITETEVTLTFTDFDLSAFEDHGDYTSMSGTMIISPDKGFIDLTFTGGVIESLSFSTTESDTETVTANGYEVIIPQDVEE